MTLTNGRGPFSGRRAGIFSAPVPSEAVYVEPFQRRVRATIGEKTVVDSERVLLVHRPRNAPAYAFPAEDVSGVPAEALEEMPGYVHVGWDAVDGWYEEYEQVFLHPRNPYHRIDCLPTQRRLRVTVSGTVLVDTADTTVLYETSLDPRLYVHPRHVLAGSLVPTTTTTYCPYKGTATYWSADLGGAVVADVAWSYEEPNPESGAIAGLLSFDESRATVEAEVPPPVELHP
jgi:uncharacterized protein (DUF427 family)